MNSTETLVRKYGMLWTALLAFCSSCGGLWPLIMGKKTIYQYLDCKTSQSSLLFSQINANYPQISRTYLYRAKIKFASNERGSGLGRMLKYKYQMSDNILSTIDGVRCRTVRCKTVQYSAVQCSAVQ